MTDVFTSPLRYEVTPHSGRGPWLAFPRDVAVMEPDTTPVPVFAVGDRVRRSAGYRTALGRVVAVDTSDVNEQGPVITVETNTRAYRARAGFLVAADAD
ncbi:hypothetical protein [Embleya sp. AB8]|uniref:hypothetical protein n=1 Tax=Embleya sp. AB8 TaxID=3156304 RepID=UPI003C781B89